MKIKAKKRFGQNFLKDEVIKQKIIEAMPNDDLEVVEIGPGLGDLTKKLLQKGKNVTAFEIDLELCELLQDSFKEQIEKKQLNLICSDVLKKWSKNLVDFEYNLIANLPYYIATNIILKALEDSRCKNILVMVQKEVALKFCAKAGDREFSSLSVFANLIGKSQILFDVPKEAFSPMPKVTSSILKIEKEKDFSAFFDKDEFLEFKEFLKVAFSQPRKTLVKNLQKFDKQKVASWLEENEISPTARPHQLSPSQYHLLFKYLK